MGPSRKLFLVRRDDPLVAQHSQLLGDERLIQRQEVLQLLDRAAPADEDFEQADARGMGERAEEARLEGLQIPGGRVAPVRHLENIIY